MRPASCAVRRQSSTQVKLPGSIFGSRVAGSLNQGTTGANPASRKVQFGTAAIVEEGDADISAWDDYEDPIILASMHTAPRDSPEARNASDIGAAPQLPAPRKMPRQRARPTGSLSSLLPATSDAFIKSQSPGSNTSAGAEPAGAAAAAGSQIPCLLPKAPAEAQEIFLSISATVPEDSDAGAGADIKPAAAGQQDGTADGIVQISVSRSGSLTAAKDTTIGTQAAEPKTEATAGKKTEATTPVGVVNRSQRPEVPPGNNKATTPWAPLLNGKQQSPQAADKLMEEMASIPLPPRNPAREARPIVGQRSASHGLTSNISATIGRHAVAGSAAEVESLYQTMRRPADVPQKVAARPAAAALPRIAAAAAPTPAKGVVCKGSVTRKRLGLDPASVSGIHMLIQARDLTRGAMGSVYHGNVAGWQHTPALPPTGPPAGANNPPSNAAVGRSNRHMQAGAPPSWGSNRKAADAAAAARRAPPPPPVSAPPPVSIQRDIDELKSQLQSKLERLPAVKSSRVRRRSAPDGALLAALNGSKVATWQSSQDLARGAHSAAAAASAPNQRRLSVPADYASMNSAQQRSHLPPVVSLGASYPNKVPEPPCSNYSASRFSKMR